VAPNLVNRRHDFTGHVCNPDNTPVCTKQMCSYRDRPEEFAALDATVVGISPQDLDSHRGFIEKNNLTVPLLADVDKQVAKAYSPVL
jgi:peroxiredoxin Q/BCP